jgi:hypothetical protein
MMPAVRFAESSPIEVVSVSAWRHFVDELAVQPFNAVSRHGGLGAYDIRPRRLVEIERATNFRRVDGRQECDFILPWTEKRFLADAIAQYAVLVKSMRLYYDALGKGEIVRPKDMSLSGALVVLHAGGYGAIGEWPNFSFKGTKKLYEAAKGIF